MEEKKKSSLLLPVIVGLGLTALVAVIALTDIFDPLIAYIHENSITPVGAILCVVFAIICFYGVYKLLAMLGKSFLPKDD